MCLESLICPDRSDLFVQNSCTTFKCNLEKNGYEIRVFQEDNEGYLLEYSYDGFRTKQFKTYGSRYAFLKAK